MYTDAVFRPRKYKYSSDQPARLVHRGVIGSPRVMVQHSRVVVGATSYQVLLLIP